MQQFAKWTFHLAKQVLQLLCTLNGSEIFTELTELSNAFLNVQRSPPLYLETTAFGEAKFKTVCSIGFGRERCFSRVHYICVYVMGCFSSYFIFHSVQFTIFKVCFTFRNIFGFSAIGFNDTSKNNAPA